MPYGTVAWGSWLSLAVWLLCAGALALVLSLSVRIRPYVAYRWRFLSLPFTWTLLNQLFERLGLPLALSVGWIDIPEWLSLVSVAGVQGSDLVLGAAAASVGELGRAWRARERAMIAPSALCAAVALAMLLAARLVPAPVRAAPVLVHAVQPAIPTASFREAQVSLYRRGKLERELDQLTAEALRREPGVVVLPEGGNGLFNRRIERRRGALSELLRGSSSELFLASSDLTPDGHLYNAVDHVTSEGFQGQARKAHPVPLAEGNLTPGEARALRTRWGALGVSICFDAAFGSHMHDLAADGATAVVVVADDASFGWSFLVDVHLAYARLRALEIGRPLLFLSNGGPIAVYDAEGWKIALHPASGRAAVHSVSLPTATTPTLATRGGSWIGRLAPLLFFPLAWRRRIRPTQPARHGSTLATPGGRYVARFIAVVLVALAALPVEAAVVAAGRGRSWEDVSSELQARVSPPAVLESMGALFRQSEQTTCGPTAAAYVLTRLGDQIFGDELARSLRPDNPAGYSLAELRRMIEARGFASEAFSGTLASLPANGAAPVIAHMRIGHFVSVLRVENGTVSFFDPATGRVHAAPAPAFEAAWSGRFLRVRTRPG